MQVTTCPFDTKSTRALQHLFDHDGFQLLGCLPQVFGPVQLTAEGAREVIVDRFHYITSRSASMAPADFMACKMVI